MERLDKNLWYRVKRFPPQPNLLYDPVTDHYRKTGIMREEASNQQYAKIVSTSGNDKNTSFQLPKTNLQPILPQRTFVDLDPSTRVIGKLDLTRGERQKTAVIKSIQNVSDMIENFISSPRLDADGNPVIDPITNLPIMEQKSLKNVLAVSQTGLIDLFRDHNVALTQNLGAVISTLTSKNILNILAHLRVSINAFPNMTLPEKTKAFTIAVLNERMIDMDTAPDGMVKAVGDELVDEKVTEFENNWDTPYTADKFPARGFTSTDWNMLNGKSNLNQYLMAKLARTPLGAIFSVDGNPLKIQQISRQFSTDRLHVLDLKKLRFYRPNHARAKKYVKEKHS